MRPRSLRARLVAGTAAWVVVGSALGGVALSLAFRRTAEGTFTQRLDSLLLAAVGALDVPPAGPLVVSRPIADARFERPYSGWYWQAQDGTTTLRSRSLWDATLPLDGVPSDAATHDLDVRGPRGEVLRARVRTLRYPSRTEPVVVAVAGPDAEIREDIHRFDRLLALSLGTLTLGLAGVLVVQLGYALRPLRRLANELAAVRTGRARRLGGAYPGEIQPLVQAMNDVLEHDAALIERARTHAGNLAHALKTPLAVVSAEAAHPSNDGSRRIAEQVAVMNGLVDRHLARAAAAGTERVPGARTEVAPVAAALRDTLARLHADRRLVPTVSVQDGAPSAGEREDLEELLGTLFDNACKWAGSRAVLTVRSGAGRLRVTIDDDGPGLTPEEAEHVLRRGVRLDTGAPGSGLGLAIAADLAELYGTTLRLGRSELGGLRAEVELPAA